MQVFNNLNNAVGKKFENLESKEIDKNITNILKIEETFKDINNRLDSSINHMINFKTNKELIEDLKLIN